MATGGAEDGHVELDLSAAGVARILAYSKPLALRRPLADRAGLETKRRAEARSDHKRERNRRHQEHTRGSDDARKRLDGPSNDLLAASDNPHRLNAHRNEPTANGDGHPESNATWARQSRNFAFGNPANPSTHHGADPGIRDSSTAVGYDGAVHALASAREAGVQFGIRAIATGHGLTLGGREER